MKRSLFGSPRGPAVIAVVVGLFAAFQSAPAQVCHEGRIGAGPRLRRVIVEQQSESLRLHIYGRPTTVVPLNGASSVTDGLEAVSADGASAGRHPAVILISGSGAQDRNETVAGHRPFLILADHLTRRGFAVLRVDDRGAGGSTGHVLQAGMEDIAQDVRAGIDYLRTVPEVDAARIGMLQVPPSQSVPALERAFGGARRELLTSVRLPGVNHMLQPAATGRLEEYAAIEETVAASVLDALDRWINRMLASSNR